MVSKPLRLFGEGLSISMKPFNIHVHVCPGYIKTAMTENHTFKMPGIMTVEEAVKKMFKGIKREKAMVIFPKITLFKIKIFQSIPLLYRMALSKMPKKEPMKF